MQGGSAKIQAGRIARNLPISHFWWAAGMTLAALVMIIAYKKLTHCRWRQAIKLGFSLLLIRFISFGPWLNNLRGKKMFYIGKESIQDQILKNWFPIAWVTALGVLIYTNFF
jgi:hypothetical protein